MVFWRRAQQQNKNSTMADYRPPHPGQKAATLWGGEDLGSQLTAMGADPPLPVPRRSSLGEGERKPAGDADVTAVSSSPLLFCLRGLPSAPAVAVASRSRTARRALLISHPPASVHVPSCSVSQPSLGLSCVMIKPTGANRGPCRARRIFATLLLGALHKHNSTPSP